MDAALFDMELLIIHVVDLAQPSKDVFLHFMLVMVIYLLVMGNYAALFSKYRCVMDNYVL